MRDLLTTVHVKYVQITIAYSSVGGIVLRTVTSVFTINHPTMRRRKLLKMDNLFQVT